MIINGILYIILSFHRVVSSTGGAAISEEVQLFCNDVLNLGLVSLYGTRETGGIARNGIVYSQVDIYMRPLDECELPSTLAKEGSAPKLNKRFGEICVSTPRLVAGYIDSAETQKKFVEVDGNKYYCTGDIGILSFDRVS